MRDDMPKGGQAIPNAVNGITWPILSGILAVIAIGVKTTDERHPLWE